MFWQVRLFAFYMFSLRLDTSFPSLHLVTLFVDQCNKIDQSFSARSVPQDAVGRQEPWEAALGALHTVAVSDQPAASHIVSIFACQAPCR